MAGQKKYHAGKHQDGGRMPDDWRVYDADGKVVEKGFDTLDDAKSRAAELNQASE